MASTLGGYSQTGPRGPDFYQMKPQPDENPRVPAPAKDKQVKVQIRQPKEGTFEVTKADAKAPVGEGGRFAAMKQKLSGQKGVTSPGGLAAYIGRMKFGRSKFNKMAAKGREEA